MKKTLIILTTLLGTSASFAALPTQLCTNGFEVQAHFTMDDAGKISCSLMDNYVSAELACEVPNRDVANGGNLSKLICKGHWTEHEKSVPVVLNLTAVQRSKEDSKLLASFVRHPIYTGLPIAIACH